MLLMKPGGQEIIQVCTCYDDWIFTVLEIVIHKTVILPYSVFGYGSGYG